LRSSLPARKLNRLSNYDYSSDGMYFVTICSKDRSNIFSDIRNNVGTGLAPVRLELSPLGFIIDQNWKDITIQYLEYIRQHNLNISGQIWQRSFHDHVIRNEKSLAEIRAYIINNPLNWENDKNNIQTKTCFKIQF